MGSVKLKDKKLIYGTPAFKNVKINTLYGNTYWTSVRVNIPSEFGIQGLYSVTGTVSTVYGLITCFVTNWESTYINLTLVSSCEETRDISINILALAW